MCLSTVLCQGGMIRQNNAEFLTEIFLSDKIIRKTKIFPFFGEIFPVFAVLTLLFRKTEILLVFPGNFPGKWRFWTRKNFYLNKIVRFHGVYFVFSILTLLPSQLFFAIYGLGSILF